MPDWVKEILGHWLSTADIKQGKLFYLEVLVVVVVVRNHLY
jgi:hypothetical protein